MKFLIVDDSKLARKKISSLLLELGHDVISEASNGLEALKISAELKPDCITMDLEMPVMKGNEAAKKILALQPDIKIILITSIVDKKEITKAQQIGIKKVLKKPINLELLSLAIASLED